MVYTVRIYIACFQHLCYLILALSAFVRQFFVFLPFALGPQAVLVGFPSLFLTVLLQTLWTESTLKVRQNKIRYGLDQVVHTAGGYSHFRGSK